MFWKYSRGVLGGLGVRRGSPHVGEEEQEVEEEVGRKMEKNRDAAVDGGVW